MFKKFFSSATKILTCIAIFCVIIGSFTLASCQKIVADMVVFGKIFTSENNQLAEAFAVKDGKFIYVGDKNGVKDFIDKKTTEIIDYTGKGIITPSFGNGHAHYQMGYGIKSFGTIIDREGSVEQFLNESVPEAVKNARKNNSKSIFGFGWNMIDFQKNMPTRQQLDAICSDIPMYFADEEGHKGIANTNLLIKAGIMSADGKVLKKEIRGGEIVMAADGTPTGFLKEQAGTYVRSFLDFDNLLPIDLAKENMTAVQNHLLSEGYTMYVDGWSTCFFNDNFYKAAQEFDKSGKMKFILGLTREIESWMDVDKALADAINYKKYSSTHVKPNWIKLFMDGTVESGTGFIEPLYPDGHQGIPNWSEEELTEITKKANSKGLSMHVHVMGNKGVNRVVNSFINGGKSEMRNTLVHVYGVLPSDYKRMAENNIYVTEGMLWHHATDDLQDELKKILPDNMKDKGYPMKSYFDNGVIVSSHTDFPALSGSSDDPFDGMETMVTGEYYPEKSKAFWTEECLTREQALQAMTINVAKQMFLENERGSIKQGKFADFLLVDKDILTCPTEKIHEAKNFATYFEGEKVFSR